MAKKIEDYLHLYLKCDVLVYEDDSFEKFGYDKLLGVSGIWAILSTAQVPMRFIKPILRPLSSMTEEEKIFVTSNYIKPGWTGKQLLEDNDDDWAMRVRHTEHGEKSVYVSKKKFEPWLFQFLLSKGFDLFGLIEAGLALSSLNTKNNDK